MVLLKCIATHASTATLLVFHARVVASVHRALAGEGLISHVISLTVCCQMCRGADHVLSHYSKAEHPLMDEALECTLKDNNGIQFSMYPYGYMTRVLPSSL